MTGSFGGVFEGVGGGVEGEFHSLQNHNFLLGAAEFGHVALVHGDEVVEHPDGLAEVGVFLGVVGFEFRDSEPGLLGVEQCVLEFAGFGTIAEAASFPNVVVLNEGGWLDSDGAGGGGGGAEAGDDVGDAVAGEGSVFIRFLDGDADGLGGIDEIVRPVHDVPVEKVGTGVALGVGFSRPDLAAVGAAENADEFAGEGDFLLHDAGVEIVEVVFLIAQGAGHAGCLVEGSRRVVEGS